MKASRGHPPFQEALQPARVGLRENSKKFSYLASSPDKLVRSEHQYASIEEALINIRYHNQVLQLFDEQYNIPHVDYQVILGQSERSALTTYTIVDKLDNAVGYDELLKHEISAQNAVEIGEEVDFITSKLLHYLKDVALDGGILIRELPRLDQFVYISSRPRGERCLLVDVDPLSAYVLQGFEGGPNDLQDCTLIADTLQYLVMDTMRLEQKLDRVSLAREDIYTFLDIIPDTVSTVITQLKHDLRRALDTND